MDRKIGNNIYNLLKREYKGIGVYYYEMYLFNDQDTKYWCDMGVYFIAKKVLIGIELKDWKKPVPYSIVKKELGGYKNIFDYMYIVANFFSKKVYNLKEIGMISKLDDNYNIIRKPEKLKPNKMFRDSFIRRLKTHCDYKLIERSVKNRSIDEFMEEIKW